MHYLLDIDSLAAEYGPSGTWARANGKRVTERRKRLNLSLAQLGRLVDKPAPTIHKLEAGDFVPRDYLKLALAHALAVEVDDLFPMPPRSVVAQFNDVPTEAA